MDVEMTHDPQAVAAVLQGSSFPWGVAGGWAIDLAIGRQTRPHADTDVVMWKDDAPALVNHLGAGWEVSVVRNGEFLGWRPDDLGHQVWVRPRGGEWAFEALFETRVDEEWVFRRNPAVTAPANRLFGQTVDGVRLIWLPIALLYKAKRHRPVDQADLEVALPALDRDERTWLRLAVTATHGTDHPWVEILS